MFCLYFMKVGRVIFFTSDLSLNYGLNNYMTCVIIPIPNDSLLKLGNLHKFEVIVCV